jgi:hypothetical protein
MSEYHQGIITGVLGYFIFRKMMEYAFLKLYYFLAAHGHVPEKHKELIAYLESKYASKP